MEKNKNETVEEVREIVDVNEEEIKPNVAEKANEVVNSARELAEKGADLASEAAKVVVDFADGQLKNAKSFFSKLNDDFGEAKFQRDLNKFQPVFLKDIESEGFSFPEVIYVVDSDKRMNVEACKGAIGYKETIKNTNILGIYKEEIDNFNLDFYPKITTSIYYVHPFDKKKYIEINDYFTFLNQARIAELKKIAQALGAKHFKISLMEEKSNEISKKDNAKAKLGVLKNNFGLDANKSKNEVNYESLGVVSESRYDNSSIEPFKPELTYWKNDETINGLIDQRLAKDSPLTYEEFKLDYNIATGITESEALKLDGVLKVLKFNGAGSISTKAKEESKRKFEYLIEF